MGVSDSAAHLGGLWGREELSVRKVKMFSLLIHWMERIRV